MRKSRPKSAIRPSSAIKGQISSTSDVKAKPSVSKGNNEKISYQSAKRLMDSKHYSQMVVLQKGSLLPILSTYQPRILKHILITQQKHNLSKTTISVPSHKNCQIHQINIKTIISYFVQWKRVMRNQMQGFQSLLNEVNDNLKSRQVVLLREELINKLKNVSKVNDLMGKKLQTYIQKQGQHYISQRIQSHLQNPPNKPQPLSKQSIQIITKKNHSKIGQIYEDYCQYKRVTNAILEIFYCLQRVSKVIKINDKINSKNENNNGGIVFEQVEEMLNKIKSDKSMYLEQQYVLGLTSQLWSIVGIKIREAFTLCNNNNTGNEFNNSGDILNQQSDLYIGNMNKRNFMAMEKVVKSSKGIDKGMNSSKGYKEQQQLKRVSSMTRGRRSQLLSTSNNQQTYKSSVSKEIINLNLVQLKLQKLFPLLIKSVINKIHYEIQCKGIMKEYYEYIERMILQVNKKSIKRLSKEQESNKLQSIGLMVGINSVKEYSNIKQRYDKSINQMQKSSEWFQSTIQNISTGVNQYKRRLLVLKQQHFLTQQQKDKEISQKQQNNKQNNLLLINEQQYSKHINKSIQCVKGSLQLYFIQLIIDYIGVIQSQQSVLYLVKDNCKVYNTLKQSMLKITNILIMDWNIGNNNQQKGQSSSLPILLSSLSSSSSQLFTLITQWIRQYSVYIRTMQQINVDISMLLRNNVIKNEDDKDKQLVQYFEDVRQVVEKYLINKQSLCRWLKQKVVNVWVNSRKTIVKESILSINNKLSENNTSINSQQLSQTIKSNIQLFDKYISKQISSITPLNYSNGNNNVSSTQFQDIKQLITLIRYTQNELPQLNMFINPQQYLTSLSLTSQNKNNQNNNNNILTNKQLLTDILQLNNTYKQFMTLMTDSQLINYVIQKQSLSKTLLQQLIDNNNNNHNNGQIDIQSKIQPNNQQGNTKQQQIVLNGSNQQKQKTNDNTNVFLPFLFPKVPMILNPTQVLPITTKTDIINTNTNTNIINTNTIKNNKPIAIYQILHNRLFIHCIPIIQKTRQQVLILHRLVGESIDNLEQMQQMQKFNQQLSQSIQWIQSIKQSKRVIQFVNEMVKRVVKQWEQMMKWNQFGKSINIKEFMRIYNVINDIKIKDRVIERETINGIKSYFIELSNKAICIQPIILKQNKDEGGYNNRNKGNANNQHRNIYMLQKMSKQLQLGKYTDLKISIREFLKHNNINVLEYSIKVDSQLNSINIQRVNKEVQSNNNNVQINKLSSQQGQSKLSSSSRITIMYKSNLNKQKLTNNNANITNLSNENSNKHSQQQLKTGLLTSTQYKASTNNRVEVSVKFIDKDILTIIEKVLPSMLTNQQKYTDKETKLNTSQQNILLKQNLLQSNSHKFKIQTEDIQYLQYYFTNIQTNITELISLTKGNKINQSTKQLSTKQQSTQKITITIINDINSQLLSFIKLLTKVFVYNSQVYKVLTKDINDIFKGDKLSTQLSHNILQSIKQQFQQICINTVKQRIKNNNHNKGKPISQKDIGSNYNNEFIISGSQLLNQNNMFEQLSNMIKLMCKYDKLHKQKIFTVIKLNRYSLLTQERVDQRDFKGDQYQQLDCYFDIIIQSKQKQLEQVSKSIKDIIPSISRLGLKTVQQSLLSLTNSRSQQVTHNSYSISDEDILQLSQSYYQIVCSGLTKQSENNSRKSQYYSQLKINIDNLIEKFIFNKLIVNNKLLLIGCNQQDKGDDNKIELIKSNDKSVDIYALITLLINNVNYLNQQRGRSKLINNSKRLLLLKNQYQKFIQHVDIVRHFYQQHYLTFIQHITKSKQIQSQLSSNQRTNINKLIISNNNNKGKVNNPFSNKKEKQIKTTQNHQISIIDNNNLILINQNNINSNNLSILIQDLFSIWDKFQSFIALIMTSNNNNNQNLNYLNLKQLYGIVKQLLICENKLMLNQIQNNKNYSNENTQIYNTKLNRVENSLLLIEIKQKISSNLNKSDKQQQSIMVGLLLLRQLQYLDKTLRIQDKKITEYQRHNQKQHQQQINNNIINSKLSQYQALILKEYYWKQYNEIDVIKNKQIQGKVSNRQLLDSKHFIEEFRKCVLIKQSDSQALINQQSESLQVITPFYKEISYTIQRKFIVINLFNNHNNQLQAPNNGLSQLLSKGNNNDQSVLMMNMKQRLNQYVKKVSLIRKGQYQSKQLINQINQLTKYIEWKKKTIQGYIQTNNISYNNKQLQLQSSIRMRILQGIVERQKLNYIQQSNQHLKQQRQQNYYDQQLFGTNNGLLQVTNKGLLQKMNINSKHSNKITQQSSIFSTLNKNLPNIISIINQTNKKDNNQEEDNEMRLIQFGQSEELISKRLNSNKIDINNKGGINKNNYSPLQRQDWLLTNFEQLEQLQKHKQQLQNYIQAINNNNHQYIPNKNLSILEHLIYSIISSSNQNKQQKNNKEQTTIIQQLRQKINDNSNKENNNYWWQQLSILTSSSNKQITCEQKLFQNNNQQQSSYKNKISIIVQDIITKTQRYLLEQRKWFTQQEKISSTIQQKELNIFYQFIKHLINTLKPYTKTQLYLPLISEKQSNQTIKLKYQIKINNNNNKSITQNNNTLQQFDSTQIIIQKPFTQVDALLLINNRKITKQQLIQKIFYQYILRYIVKQTNLDGLTKINQQLPTYMNNLKIKLQNIYSLLKTQNQQQILQWNQNQLQYQQKYQQQQNKLNSLQILFTILINWAQLIEAQRIKNQQNQKNIKNKQQNKQQQKFNKEKQKQKSKLNLFKTQQQNINQIKSQTSSQLQLQFALSDAWGVDHVEFIQNLNQFHKNKFYQVQRKIINNKQTNFIKNNGIDAESQLEISINLSENHDRQTYAKIHQKNFTLIRPSQNNNFISPQTNKKQQNSNKQSK